MAGGKDDNMSVAITGLACRFPGKGDNLENFWESICNGESAWSKIPRDRFNPDAFYHGLTEGGHFLKEDISLFDANFFNVSHAEACAMDPQQRLMLEVVYEALEAAGCSMQSVAGTATGVFMGQFTSDYRDVVGKDAEASLPFSMTGLQATSLSNRVSWLLDLRGPSFTVDTACSSSLVALHLACQSLRSGESEMAIVGGCNLMINPDMFIYQTGQKFLSPDGLCKTFDASADGYGRGEGFAVVVLKRVKDAISEGDPIRAVVRATGSNQDGHTKGFTLPSSEAQAALIRDVYESAGLDFGETGYVEAHGTGTKAGDLEETTALCSTISAARSPSRPLIVGSVKSNIGHLEAGAGLAGVIKSVLVLESGAIPPNIHLKNPNPKIPFAEWNLKIPTSLTPWPSDESGLRRISVNSFGYGGTNAHVVIDDARSYLQKRGLRGVHFTQSAAGISAAPAPVPSTYRLFAISAQDKESLGTVKKTLASHLNKKAAQLQSADESNAYASNLAFTLSERRSHLQWKTYAVASSIDELADILVSPEQESTVARSSRKPRLGFVFTGQGAQWPSMGIELLQHAVFRESVEAADKHLRETLECGWSAAEELARGKSTSKIGNALYSQTLCTVLQVALVDLIRSWDVEPVAVVGHSSGEIGAAYCAGVLSREDAWTVAYWRGLLSSQLRDSDIGVKGAMMAVGSSPEDAEKVIARVAPGEVHVACINSPQSVTLSGDPEGIDKVQQALQDEGVFARKLLVDTAYHSPHMQIVAQDYLEAIADISTSPTFNEGCTMYSSVTGRVADPTELGATYWVRNLISPVQFASAIQSLGTAGIDALIEIGPHSALQGPATQSLKGVGLTNVPYYSMLLRNQGAIRTAMNLAGTLFANGYPVDFGAVNQLAEEHAAKPLVDLPSYPWNHKQPHWAESRIALDYRLRQPTSSNLLGAPCPSLVAGERVWRGHMKLSERPWLADHKIQGSILYPGAGFLALAVEAALATADASLGSVTRFRLRDIHLMSALVIPEDTDVEYSVSLRPHLLSVKDTSGTWTEFTVSSFAEGNKTMEQNCTGLILVEHGKLISDEPARHAASMANFKNSAQQCQKSVKADDFYRDLDHIGLTYGPAFRNVTNVKTGPGNKSHCVVKIPDVGLEALQRPHVIHPGTLDAIFHMAFAALGDVTQPMVPKSIDELVIAADISWEPGTSLKGLATSVKTGYKEMVSDILMTDQSESYPVMKIAGFCCTEVAGAQNADAAGTQTRSVFSKLVWQPALGLLTADEEKDIITRLASTSGSPITAGLTQLVKLLHHSKSVVSVFEVVSQDPKVSRPYLCEMDIDDVLKTADYTLWCSDESIKEAADEVVLQGAKVDVKDLKQSESNDAPEKADLIVLSVLSGQPEGMVRNAKQLLDSEGRLCLIVPSSQAADMETLGRSIGLTNWIKISDSEKQHTLLIGSSKSKTSVTNGSQTLGEGKVKILQSSSPSEAATKLATKMQESLRSLGFTPSVASWKPLDRLLLNGEMCISLLEMDGPALYELQEEEFNNIKALMLGTKRLLWVSGTSESDPSSGIVTGLARVVRNEEPGLVFRTLHADLSSLRTDKFADLAVRAFSSDTADNEFVIQDGALNVCRLVEDDKLNGELHLMNPQNRILSKTTLRDAPGPLKLCVQNAGLLDSLCFEPDDVEEELGEDEVEITVKATSLNFRDVMTVLGQVPGMDIGWDAAGIVRRVGSSVQDKFAVGDRVAMCNYGAHRTVHRGKAEFCQVIPEHMTFEEAATIPLVHGTAWYALIQLARARKGQSVLIHAAAGGVGQAAIQIAQHIGMQVFATVGSEPKRALLRDQYGIPDDCIFNSRDLSFAVGIKQKTKGRGVDVVLNSLAGEALRQTWHCIAPLGVFVEIGLKDILANSRLDMKPLLHGATFTFFDLKRIIQQRPEIMGEIMQGVFDLQTQKITKPITPFVVYPVSEVESAFRLMQAGKHLGKIVLSFANPDDVVPVLSRHEKPMKLDPNAYYVLSGGLGGLGRSLATMLVDSGAQKLCFLSRSGAKSAAAQRLVQDLEKRGAQVLAPSCDVSDSQGVKDTLKQCSEQFGGRVGGVIQGAMVLRDRVFRNMTYDEWTESTRPKVQGTWNLHASLPNEVDFFISLASFVNIFGNKSQANYSAGGAYQDAIGHFRRARGQHAVTVDVGVMREVGVLAEQGMTGALAEFEMPFGLSEREFLDVIKMAIAGDISGDVSPQLTTGLGTGAAAAAAGISPWYFEDARFANLARTGMRSSAEQDNGGSSVQTQLAEAKSIAEAADSVLNALVDRVAKMLQTSAAEIDTDRFLHSYGIDSLVAIEVVNWALKECKSSITVFDIMAAVPMTATARKIAMNSSLLPKELLETKA